MTLHAHKFDQGASRLARQFGGQMAYLAGCAAEDQVAMTYAAQGYVELARRWRAGPGELDLVFEDSDGTIIFVEVKKAKDFDTALSRITRAKAHRLFATGEMFLGTLPAEGLTECRFDVAAVNNMGEIEIHENFFAGGF